MTCYPVSYGDIKKVKEVTCVCYCLEGRERGEMESGEHMGVGWELWVMEAPHFPVEPENSKRPLQQHPYNTPECVQGLAWQWQAPLHVIFLALPTNIPLLMHSLSLSLSIWEDVKKYNHA